MSGSLARRWVLAIAFTALLGMLVAACGSSDDDGNDASQETVLVTGETGATGATGTTGETAPADAVTGETVPGTGVPVTGELDPVSDGRLFSAESPWNTSAEGMPVASDSDRMLELATQRRAVREVPGQEGVETFVRRVDEGLAINTEAWAPLIVLANTDDSAETRFVCRQSKCSVNPKLPDSISIPANTTPDPRYDGWLSVIDRQEGMGYDFWRARREGDGTISYQFGKTWSLDGPGFSQPVGVDPERAVGARGSGLPLFAGVIGPEELEAGQIDHALAISVPGLARRNFVQPASVTDGVGNQRSLPAGARLRLRSDVAVNERRLQGMKGQRRRSADAILTALRTYGAIVVDRAVVPSLYAPLGTSADVVRGSELSWLKLEDFEVIALPQIYKDPPLSEVGLEGPETGSDNSQVQSGSAAAGSPGGAE